MSIEVETRVALSLGWDSRSPSAVVGIVAAAATVLVEALFYFQGTPAALHVGQVAVSPSIVPGLVALCAGGARLTGRARSRDHWLVFWVLAVLSVCATLVAMSERETLASAGGVLVAALGEELVYRFAGPVVAAYGLVRLGLEFRAARIAGFVVAGVAFVVLPGHVAQWSHPLDVLPFAAYAWIAALAVIRSGAVAEVAMVHGLLNLVNLGRLDDRIGTTGPVLVGASILLLVLAYVPPVAMRRVPEPDVVIDLTGPEPRIVRTDAAPSTPPVDAVRSASPHPVHHPPSG